ncbi:MAG: cytochrome b [Gammaproteobacteria bacterium]|nr:cytochrome b [Gammaproteobacteria bacterium]
MNNKNTADDYGRVARWLHWGTAILFLLAYMVVYYRHWFTERQTAENLISLHLHLSFGITIGVIVILRIIWRNMNERPILEPGPGWQHLLAHLGHYTLYAIMILMPLSGYMGTGTNTKYFYLFEIPKFSETWLFDVFVWDYLGLTFEEFEKPIDFFHKEIMGAWLVWMLIVGHACAAFYHHFKLKDRTLIKMTRGE